MSYIRSDELYHHGRKGQKWGVTNGPPYPLSDTNKTYDRKQSVTNTMSKVKQFLYDRFDEYGKDHQAVRDRLVSSYMRKGYNETASQILAENRYQAMDRAFIAGSISAAALVVGIPFSVMGVSSAIAKAGGVAAIKKAIGSTIMNKVSDAMSQTLASEIPQITSIAVRSGAAAAGRSVDI